MKDLLSIYTNEKTCLFDEVTTMNDNLHNLPFFRKKGEFEGGDITSKFESKTFKVSTSSI